MIYRFRTQEMAEVWLKHEGFFFVPGTDQRYYVRPRGYNKQGKLEWQAGELAEPPGNPNVTRATFWLYAGDTADCQTALTAWKAATHMDEATYLRESERTASVNFHTHQVPPEELEGALIAIEAAMNWADEVKAALFYNREMIPRRDAGGNVKSMGRRTSNKGSSLAYQPEHANVLHGVLGLVTESGEMSQNVLKVLRGDIEFDRVNMIEELGDCLWYVAMLCRELGIMPSQAMDANIAKLRKRFPTSFTEEAANNRDLEGERKVLEQAVLPTPPEGAQP